MMKNEKDKEVSQADEMEEIKPYLIKGDALISNDYRERLSLGLEISFYSNSSPDLTKTIDISRRWQEVCLAHYLSSVQGIFKEEWNQIEFLATFFENFQQKLSKKLGIFVPEARLRAKVSHEGVKGLVSYFKVLNRQMLLQEKHGFQETEKMMSITRKKLTQLIQEDILQSKEDRLTISHKEELVENYVFCKRSWLCDIKSKITVCVSDQFLDSISNWNAKECQKFYKPLVLYLYNLSQKVLNIGFANNATESYRTQYQRQKSHADYILTYFTYERFTRSLHPIEMTVICAAVLPRRIPVTNFNEQTKKLQFKRFALEQYVTVLGLIPTIDKSEFWNCNSAVKTFGENCIPHARLEPFKIDKGLIMEDYDFRIASDRQRASAINQHVLNAQDMTKSINAALIKNIDDRRIRQGAGNQKENFQIYMVQEELGFMLDQYYPHQTKKFNISISFRFENLGCYEQDSQTGFYRYNPELQTEEFLRKACQNVQFPKYFRKRAQFQLQKEIYFVSTKRRVIKPIQEFQTEADKNNYMDKKLKSTVYSVQQTLQMVQKCENRQMLGKVLDMVPSLNLKLNLNQQQIIDTKNDLFILGRSGTGKTTITVLRFFCLEIMYCAMRKQQRLLGQFMIKNVDEAQIKEAKRKIPALTPSDLGESTSLKMVFVTASPVLTNEVKQYYSSLKEKLKTHLECRITASNPSEAQNKPKEIDQNEENMEKDEKSPSKIDYQSEKVLTEEQSAKKQEELKQFVEQKYQEITMKEQIEDQLSLPERLSDLKANHFPLFVTVQRIIYMMDASLGQSFFTRDRTGKIIGMESGLGWQSEQGGVFTINQDFKRSQEIKSKIENFELQILTGDQNIQLEDSNQFGRSNIELFTDLSHNDQQKFDSNTGLLENDQLTENSQQQYPRYVGNLESKFNQRQFNEQHRKSTSKKRIEKSSDIEMFQCIEVTYEVFKDRFMPRFSRFMSQKLLKKLSPSFIWSEIMSVIKGSIYEEQVLFTGCLSLDQYTVRGNHLLTRKDKKTLYYLFLKYEDWKTSIGAFDFLDVVNHVEQRQSHFKNPNNSKFDYLIVDEVQDLYPKTIRLLLKYAKFKVVFAGDTAQTIAKGVNTRLTDLICQNKSTFKTTKPINLTINYRSQNQILQLANSVVKLIETMFPKSIDKMQEEVSEKKGPKPFIIGPVSDDLLCQYFFGQDDMPGNDEIYFNQIEKSPQLSTNQDTISKSIEPPKFGATQVVIVRDIQQKKELPKFLQSMLCLTVFESKGLEFDDVILFNFFCMSSDWTVANQWKLLQHLESQETIRETLPDWILNLDQQELQNELEKVESDFYREQKIDDPEIDDSFSDLEVISDEDELEDLEEHKSAEKSEQISKDLEKQQKRKLRRILLEQKLEETKIGYYNRKREEVIRQYEATGENADLVRAFKFSFQLKSESDDSMYRKFGQLCIELKFLYVAITRPRNRLFIHEQNLEAIEPILRIWKDIGAVQMITQEDIEKQIENRRLVQESDPSESHKQSSQGSLSQNESHKHTWKLQGLRFLKQKNYTQAIKCFYFAGESLLQSRCKAYLMANEAEAKQVEVDSEIFNIRRQLPILKKKAKRQKLSNLREMKHAACKRFFEAGQQFEKANLQIQAASCFFTARAYSKAASLFVQAESWAQAGECYSRCGPLKAKQAAQFFEKGNMALRAIQSYESIGEWEHLLHCLNRNQDQFGETERQQLINRYVPIALNSIYQELVVGSKKGVNGRGDSDESKQHQIDGRSKDKQDAQKRGMEIDEEEQKIQIDTRNVGQKIEEKIKMKYALKEGLDQEAIIEEELDEYGQELDFESDNNDTLSEEEEEDVQEVQDGTRGQNEIDEENLIDSDQASYSDNDSNDGAGQEGRQNGENKSAEVSKEFSSGFKIDSLLNTQYFAEKLEESKKGDSKNDVANEDSFEIIDSVGSENNSQPDSQDKDNKLDKVKQALGQSIDTFEHLSQFDPDDQFLKSDRSLSIIDSIISGQISKGGVGNGPKSVISDHSSFSIISSPALQSILSSSVLGAQNNQDLKSQLGVIEPKDDLDFYQQDIVAQKLIYFLSLWQPDMRAQLSELKKKGILQDQSQNEDSQANRGDLIDETDFIIQMDNVDQNFVDLILDTLEMYEFYHMSLMMCKRYRLSGRMGRYLVLMCSKYSNLNTKRVTFADLLLKKSSREAQLQSSILAHEAIHNVLCMIDADLLKMKPFGTILTNQNSLGFNTYQTMFNLGFWKKLIYILEPRLSLQLCFKFADFTNFDLIMRAFVNQDDKIKNKETLDQWTIKTQFMHLLRQRQSYLKQSKDGQFKLFQKSQEDTIKANQLNQKVLKQFSEVQKLVQEFFNQPLTETQREQLIRQIDGIIKDHLKNSRPGSSAHVIKSNIYASSFIVFDLILNCGGKRERALLRRFRDYFSQQSQDKLLSLILTTIKYLNDFSDINFDQQPSIEALFNSLLISPIAKEDSKFAQQSNMQDFFVSYRDYYHLVHIDSCIFEDIASIQQFKGDFNKYLIFEKAFKKISQKAFNSSTRSQLMTQSMKGIQGGGDSSISQWKHGGLLSSSKIAQMVDLDGHFVFVPQAWIRSVLMSRLMRVYVMLTMGKQQFPKGLFAIACDSETYFRGQRLLTLSKSFANSLFFDMEHESKFYVQKTTTGPSSAMWKQFSPQLKIRNIHNFDSKLKEITPALSLKNLNRCELLQTEDKIQDKFTLGCLLSFDAQKEFSDKYQATMDITVRNCLHLFKECVDLMSQNTLQEAKTQRQSDHPDNYDYKMRMEEFNFTNLTEKILFTFSQFVRINRCDLYIELSRLFSKTHLKKLEKSAKVPKFLQLFQVLTKLIVKVHQALQNRDLMQASNYFLQLASIGGEQQILSEVFGFQRKTKFLNFALNLLLIGACTENQDGVFLPDYTLHLLDSRTDLLDLYCQNQSEVPLLKKASSLTSSKVQQKVEQQKKEDYEEYKDEKKFQNTKASDQADSNNQASSIDKPKKSSKAYQDSDSYGEQEDYGESVDDGLKTVILKKLEPNQEIQKICFIDAQNHLTKILKAVLSLLDQISEDECSFNYQEESQLVYNMLQSVVVNIEISEKEQAQLIAKCYNRLVHGVFEDYFADFNLNPNWHEAKEAYGATPKMFNEERNFFQKEEDGLKWEWFDQLENDAGGQFVTKIDPKQAQSEANTRKISKASNSQETQNIKNQATRIMAARTIQNSVRNYQNSKKDPNSANLVGSLKEQKMAQKSKEMNDLIDNLIDGKDSLNSEKVKMIRSHAKQAGLKDLHRLPWNEYEPFVHQLVKICSQINYLQELIINKAFQNSLEISNALEFSIQLRNLYEKYVMKGQQFLAEHKDIIVEYDIIGEKPLQKLVFELESELNKLENAVHLWLDNIFEGQKSGSALNNIFNSSVSDAMRLKLKWQKLSKISKKSQLKKFKDSYLQSISQKAS